MKALYLIPLLFIFYAIAVIQSWRELHRFLKPWEWLSGIFTSLFGAYRVESRIESYRNADDAYWYPGERLIAELVPIALDYMGKNGYGSKDYIPQMKDCDDFATYQQSLLNDLFIGKCGKLSAVKGKAFPIFQFSFRRDDGKRHRLVMIIDNNKKRWFIENWRVFDKYHSKDGMFRLLSKKEQENGHIVG